MSAQRNIVRDRSITAANEKRDFRQRLENATRIFLRIFAAAATPTIASNAERQACVSKPWNDSDMISKFVMVCLYKNIISQGGVEMESNYSAPLQIAFLEVA